MGPAFIKLGQALAVRSDLTYVEVEWEGRRIWLAESCVSEVFGDDARILETLLTVFATTYSRSVQDSMYRMGEAALAAVRELADISFAMPNKHYVPIDLTPFGLDNSGAVFLPTDEPFGRIEATISRST